MLAKNLLCSLCTKGCHVKQVLGKIPVNPYKRLSYNLQIGLRTFAKATPSKSENLVFNKMFEARRNGVDLNLNEYLHGLNVCMESRLDTGDLAFWIYMKVKPLKIVSNDIFENLMRYFSSKMMLKEAKVIFPDYLDQELQPSEAMYANYLALLAKTGQSSENYSILEEIYSIYKSHGKGFGWRLDAQIYIDICVTHCKHRNSAAAIDTLRDMITAHHEPSSKLCDPLLSTALYYNDTSLLRVLASWYANHFHVRIEYGNLCRMIQVASSKGDGQLALLAFQMIARNGYHASRSNYFSLIMSLLKSGDIISAIEAIQDMEGRGIILRNQALSVDLSGEQQYLTLKKLLVQSIIGSASDTTAVPSESKKQQLDELYFALVDQVREGHQVIPRTVLDAVIEAYGYFGLRDRAFATLEEYKSIFQLEPDIYTYNSLMLSCVASNNKASLNEILSIFQDLDNLAQNNADSQHLFLPNMRSYNILLEAAINRREFGLIGEVLGHAVDSNICPGPKILRRIAIVCAELQLWDVVNQVIGLLEKHHASHDVPNYFSKRINSFNRPV